MQNEKLKIAIKNSKLDIKDRRIINPLLDEAKQLSSILASSILKLKRKKLWICIFNLLKMPKRTDIKKILIIGSGPIIISQACEFDYSGTQACKALKSEGYKVSW